MDATAGLQTSQPRPVPWREISSVNVRMPVDRRISNRSERFCPKCSHNALDCSTPAADSSCLSIGTHEPHVVPAFVHALRPGTSAQPPAMAPLTAPLVTALHEQTCASS